MSNYKEVNKNIEKLESMQPGILDFGKAIWQQIRVTGKSFKGARYPSRDKREAAVWSNGN